MTIPVLQPIEGEVATLSDENLAEAAALRAAQRTPIPWSINPYTADYAVISSDGAFNKERMDALIRMGKNTFKAISIGTKSGQVAIIPLDESSRDNAELIVKAVNCHQRLIEAIEDLAVKIKSMKGESSCIDEDILKGKEWRALQEALTLAGVA